MRRNLVFSAAFVMAIFFVAQLFFGPERTVQGVKDTTHKIIKATQQQPLSATASIQALWSSIRLPITAKTYTDPDGKQFNLTSKPNWLKPLGKDVLIIDIDTRQPTGYNQILNTTKVNWEKLGDGTYMDDNIGLTSSAIFNHYLYSQIHGYDYVFFQAKEIGYQHHTWVKVHAIPEVLKNYKFVVFLDADVTVNHMEVPLEWLFNRWKITPQTSLALPQDVTREGCDTCDSKGNVMLSSGVIVAQNIPHTHKIFDAWKSCPNETLYPGCGTWAYSWAHEQRALSEFLRYDENMNPNQNILALPCDDANGYPEKNEVKPEGMIFYSDCQGNFFQHHWLDGGKRLTKKAIGESVMQSIAEVVQKSLWDGQDNLVINQTAEALQEEKKEEKESGIW
ncbi:Nn.00g090430.m01.CDS01 [Neocucurbitaria sp. VM-36]